MQWGRASRNHLLFVGVSWVSSLRAPRAARWLPAAGEGAATFRVLRFSSGAPRARVFRVGFLAR
eukprot:1298189-Pyramimonas_sp.AAC.1